MSSPLSINSAHKTQPPTSSQATVQPTKAVANQASTKVAGDSFEDAHRAQHHDTRKARHNNHTHTAPTTQHQTAPAPTSQSLQNALNTAGGWGGQAKPVQTVAHQEPVHQAPQTFGDALSHAFQQVKDNFGHSLEHLEEKSGGGRASGVSGDRSGF